ncbi:LicD family protein [uncultured Fibrobacter sp.]|jgi:lipopolysaccharide cholinephosphotransferase|uniref:LicD family protein n=1 Tax=uncultured Fibrobacter sp. TaxID=261512 RepID=UPI0015648FB8|nr:LicD family protein [uncultured Fibrobacter sp.]
MSGIVTKFIPKPAKKSLKSLYAIIFRNKTRIKEQNKEIRALKYQLEYLKRHFDITQMKPATGYLREFQLKELDFAQHILSLLKPYGITPFLDGGALLGACRHGGFVPWDDDIDLSVTRDQFNMLTDIAQKDFVWIDSTKKNCFSAKFYDMAIRENPGKYVFILTPFCLHLFQGTCLRDSMNLEFFPNDYVREDVTEEQYAIYRDKICNFVHRNYNWKDRFDFYKKELKTNNIYSQEPTSRITPGIGNWDLTEFKFRGFRATKDLFPLKPIAFEKTSLPAPNNPQAILEASYGKNWMQFPSDVGTPHTLEEQNIYFKSIGDPIDYSEI